MLARIRRYVVPVLFILINLALAGPVTAALDDDLCVDEHGVRPCCTECILFCECTLE